MYGLDLADLYRGRLGARRAARLASQLGPGSAIHRPDNDIDSAVYSAEAQLLRTWINLNLDAKDRILTVDQAIERERRDQARKAKAQRMLERQRRQVSGG